MLDSVTAVVERRLKLKVNRDKSKVVHAREAVLLGFGLYFARGGKVGVRVDPKAVKRLKELTSRRWSVAMPERIGKINRFTAGWMGYFRLADGSHLFRELDKWLHRRMRQIRWKEWKGPKSRQHMLRKLGNNERLSREWGGTRKGYWRIAGSAVLSQALPATHWDDLGLRMLKPTWLRLRSA